MAAATETQTPAAAPAAEVKATPVAEEGAAPVTAVPPAVNAAAQAAAAAAASKAGAQGTPFRSAALYVGDISPDVTEATLFEIFNAVAPVASVRVCRHAITRRSLGYAYINFHTVRDAERVLDTMNYTMIKGRMCRLMWSQRDPSLRRSGHGNVFIKNLDPTIDSKDLFDTFSIFGNIISCKVVTDRVSGESKGYGFVHFETQEAADEAINKVNGNVISGRVVYVGNFVKRVERLSSQQWTNLYVKNIPNEWDDDKVTEMFAKYGKITSAIFVVNENAKDKTGTVRRFGYVDYEDHESAAAAVDALHGMELPQPEGSEKETEAEKTEKTEETTEDEKTTSVEGEGEESQKTEGEKPLTLYVQRFMKKRERERVVVEAKSKEKSERIKMFLGKNLYCRNLADEVTDEMLRAEFAPFGTITSARVMRDEKNNNRSRGFGFVCFSTREEAAKALHTLNNLMFAGKPLYVAMWQPREDRRQFLQRQHLAKRSNPMMNMGMGMMNRMPMMMPRGMPRGAMPFQRMPQMNRFGGMPGFGMMQQGGRGGRGGMRRGPRNQRPQRFPNRMPQMPMMQPPMVPPQQQQQQDVGTLTPAALANASPSDQKNMIGERLYPLVHAEQPDLAGKVTGMLLDGMETAELLQLLEDSGSLRSKILEAMEVLAASAAESEDA